MEGLGKQFQQARLARNITLDEAARLTKIRPGRLAEIENEDFSQFASLAYAKGFLLIYGKFLDVDVTPYLEGFETSEHVSVDGYAYLQDNPAPKPARSVVARKQGTDRGSLLPLVIGIVVLVLGFSLMKFILNVQRTKTGQAGMASVTPTPAPERIVAPRALPAENTTPPIMAAASATRAPTVAPTAQPTIAASTPAVAVSTPAIPTAPSAEPEVRRAEPVHASDLASAPASSPSSFTGGIVNRVEIRPLRKTYVKVVVDNDEQNPIFERWISPSENTVKFSGQRIAIRVLDLQAVEIKKNGKRISSSDAEVTID